MFCKNFYFIIFIAILLSGCSTLKGNDLSIEHNKTKEKVTKEVSAIDSMLRQDDANIKRDSAFVVYRDSNYGQVISVDVEKELRAKASWLDKKISMLISKPVSGLEILSMFREKGINIVSDLPIENYMYRGHGVNDLSIENALKTILVQMNLDFKIDYGSKIVRIVPMPWKTYNVNIGQRTSNFTASANIDGQASIVELVESGGEGDSGGNRTHDISTNSGEDFWVNIEKEITDKITVLIPTSTSIPVSSEDKGFSGESISVETDAESVEKQIEQGNKLFEQFEKDLIDSEELEKSLNELYSKSTSLNGGSSEPAGTTSGAFYEEQKVGRISINPETGVIHVQAPWWIHEDLKKYFSMIDARYNTQISFEGRLIQFTTTADQQRYLDVSMFSRTLEDYGFVYQNNPLGGLTLQKAGKEQWERVMGAEGLGGPLAGAYRKDKGFGLFAGYLDSFGEVVTIERPRVSTTSGVPAMFRNMTTRHFNIPSEEASDGEGGQPARTNNPKAVNIGTVLVVNPTYDPRTGILRVQLGFNQSRQTEIQTLPSVFEGGSLEIPVVSENNYSGEVVLRNGDTIIVGGHIMDHSSYDNSGIPKLHDAPVLGNFFGEKHRQGRVTTYYFVLTVNMERR